MSQRTKPMPKKVTSKKKSSGWCEEHIARLPCPFCPRKKAAAVKKSAAGQARSS